MSHKKNFLRKRGVVPSIIPIENIIEYWSMDGNSAGYFGNDGSDTSMSYPSGFLNESADFTASTSAFISVADSDDFIFGDGSTDVAFSISLWVNYNTSTNSFIICKRVLPSGGSEWQLVKSSGFLEIYLFSQDGAPYKRTRVSWSPTLSTWYHLVVTYDGSGQPKLYIDNVNVGTTSNSGTYVAMSNTTASIYMGKLNSASNFSLNGYLDEVAIFNIELTVGQVDDLYNGGLASTPVIG